jgi:hypothetical protein
MPVPHPRDKSDSNPLPDPELNPLVNPLLAAHMGRWAEVYFTNPPERRDQAVSELLRELQNVSPSEPAAVQGVPDEHAKEETETADSLPSPPSPLERVRTCGKCAYHNSAEQVFCGMCGAPLQVSPKVHVPQVGEAVPVSTESWCERTLGVNSVEDAIVPALSSAAPSQPCNAPELSSLLPEKNPPHPVVESGPIPYRYRLYVGAVLAILLVALGYTARRGPRARSETAASLPAPAIPGAQPALANSARTLSATAGALPTSTPLSSQVQSGNRADTVPVARTSAVAAVGGVEELAMAEKYLNGTSGMTRDSGEAAQWLWKAVRKRNLEATLVLSDLYLRGDGVPKSCDQARLLLDAAARKGGKAAAERLRKLQALGCE